MPPKTSFKSPLTANLLDAARSLATSGKTNDFTQSDLLSLDVCTTVSDLLAPLNELVKIGHFILLQSSSPSAASTPTKTPTYRLRKADSVSSIQSLGNDARRCYEMIESAGAGAIWSKTITMRTKMPQIVVTKSLKALEVAKLVKQMKNVKMPNRRMYLLAGLKPTEEATGGSWFSDGELDEGLVEVISDKVVDFIEGESWRIGPRKVVLPKEEKDAPPTATGISAPWDETSFYTVINRRRYPLLPHKAEYKHYPTASDVRTHIDSKNFVSDKDISVPDMQMLMDVLEWDGRIERMGMKSEAVDQDAESESESESGSGSDDEGSDIEALGAKRKRGTEDTGRRKKQKVTDDGHSDADIIHTTEPRAPAVKAMHDVPMYRTVRRPVGYDHIRGPGSAFAETPCSRCPVFDLCEDSGPINARDCEYFPGWLAKV